MHVAVLEYVLVELLALLTYNPRTDTCYCSTIFSNRLIMQREMDRHYEREPYQLVPSTEVFFG